jgi:hypothetical protein
VKRALVIIPCYNEEASLPKLYLELKKLNHARFHFEFLVVNDCSKDNTQSVAEELQFNIINLPVNLGIGGAVQSGLIYAYKNNFDIAFQMDGDGQHPPSEIHQLINQYETLNCDVVIGSRFINKMGFQSSTIRRIGIRFFSFLIKLLCGIKISDPTSGYRLFSGAAIALCNTYYPDEYPEPEAIVYFHKNKLKIAECPVAMSERFGGRSSINLFSSVYYMFKVSIAIFFTFIRKF